MAEFVQQSIEDMLPELEQMERVGLFTASETRSILKKRKGYEYKLRRRTKEKQDFLVYIQYEMNVLSLVRKRREKTGYSFKRVEIDVAIVQRIHKLFKLACFRFQEDVKLWLSHIEFSKKRKEKSTVSKLFTRMLQVHTRKPHLWILAAKWEMEENIAIDNARSLLQRGLRFNTESKQLWLEYFRMELLNADKLIQRRKILGLAHMDSEEPGMSGDVLAGKVALIVYQKSRETFTDDVNFCVSFLPIVNLFDFATQVRENILKDLKESFPDKEITWDVIARHHLQGAAQILQDAEMTKTEKVVATEMLEQNCYGEYEEAVKRLNTESMWTYYLKACIELVEQHFTKKLTEKRILHTLKVFQEALECKKLAVSMFLEWANMLRNVGQLESASQVLEDCTNQYSSNVSAWEERLGLCMKCGGTKQQVIEMIEQALKDASPKNSLSLWKLSVDWCMVNDQEYLEKLLEKGLQQPQEVCLFAKETYLEWTHLHGNLSQVKTLYKRLTQTKPLSISFFQRFINILNAQAEPSMKRIRKVYEDLIQEYGQEDTDIWINYIKLELTHPQGKPENAGQIHWKAMKTIDGQLADQFIAKYTLLQTGHL